MNEQSLIDGERLRTLRRSQKLSQKALAEKCNMERKAIWRAEAGERSSMKLARALASHFNVPLLEILNTDEVAA